LGINPIHFDRETAMLKDFVTFDKMIAPIIIKIIFWIGVGMSVLGGAFWTLTGLGTLLLSHSITGLVIALGGMLAMALGILWTRLICELYIVVFLIHDDLAVIRKSVGGTQPNVQAYASTYPQPYTQPNMPQPNIQS
jgi:hypothetical protein